jgi:hypothetical protein
MRLRAARAVFCVALSVTALVWATPAGSVGGEQHAGTVLALDTEAGTLVIDEFGANAVRRPFRVRLAPRAQVVLSERTQGAEAFDRPFTDTAIGLADVRIGDFVVVELTGGTPPMATTVVVTLRGGGTPGT